MLSPFSRNAFAGSRRRSSPTILAAEIRLLETRTLLAAPTVADDTFTVNENLPNGSNVGTVAASDPDIGETLTYAITAGNTSGAFTIDAGTGQITVADTSAIDFETNSTFSLTVEVTDDGVPSSSDTATITVNLTDVNDAPALTLGSNSLSVNENTSTSISLVVTSITIQDDALGSETLSLTGADTEFFQIVGSTLRIKAGTVLDYETKSDYTVTVNVNDPTVGGNPDASQTFTLSLNNVAEAPVIAPNQSFEIAPHPSNGLSVGTVVATDPDGGPLSYEIVVFGSDPPLFAINSSTGEITVVDGAAVMERVYGLSIRVTDSSNLTDYKGVSVKVNTLTTISGIQSNQPMQDTDIISPFSSVVITDPDTQPMFVRVTIPNALYGDFTPLSTAGWTRTAGGSTIYTRSFSSAANIGSVVQAAVRALVFQANTNAVMAGATRTMALPLFLNDQVQFVDNNDTSLIITSVNDTPVIDGAAANQPVNDNATIGPFSALTITDPDQQNMTAIVRINNGVVRGDFTPASTSGWTRSVTGNNIQYSRTFGGLNDNVGSFAQAAIRTLIFKPRENAIKPNTTETTTFNVTVADGMAAPVTDTNTSVFTTSLNNTPVITGANAAVAVNDNATVNPFASLIVSDADNQEMLAKVTILNGVVRGDFTNAVSNGWTRSVVGNNVNYVRYFSPGPAIGATVTTAYRALTFQPRQNAIKPGTAEATDFLVTVSDGVAAPAVNQNTRVTITSVNNAPTIAGAAANQTMNDNDTKAVFSSLTITDPDTQDMLVRVTIPNGVNRGDFTAPSAVGWSRTVNGSDIVYNRYFSSSGNIGGSVQTAVRTLVFQPRTNVPVGATETTAFTVFVNDGLANATNSTTSVNTTGVASRAAASPLFLASDMTTVVVPAVLKPGPSLLSRLGKLRK